MKQEKKAITCTKKRTHENETRHSNNKINQETEPRK